MDNIECEVRSFVDKGQYENLLARFKKEAVFLGEDDQTTYYFDAPCDLRIQKNNHFSKIWTKKGRMHDESREEIEIKFAKEDFEKLEKIMLSLGLNVSIKWFRTRNAFKLDDISLALDHTKGYGYIIELEKMASPDAKDETVRYLKNKMETLGIKITPREEFDQKYQYYKENWRTAALS